MGYFKIVDEKWTVYTFGALVPDCEWCSSNGKTLKVQYKKYTYIMNCDENNPNIGI